ncbi:putative portal protein [Pseudomonas phage SM1]|uniref:Putative portal protein n=1 Tax=Pseudomonas phage SM1 TaxID=1772332 RepID=A0A0U3E050_9CAUD|nr:putative portal protein [Pseudomonas phage SM1]UGC97036.1 recombination endonuclease subunit [Pseudomonas phage BHU-1]UGV19993.1 recombination endonuclease subunit D12 [Pseudomonas phage Pa BHU-15]UVN14041.1 hypothetical protein FBPa45_0039 [Pseudomonas phage vB_PaeS_FBPa45]WDS62445.1 recombination endonuclease subunit D12 [Pseudomonas phage UF_RH6]HBO9768522.1 hypothetical protein [Pseudomonas aeruginosa]
MSETTQRVPRRRRASAITARSTVIQVKRADADTSRQVDFLEDWTGIDSAGGIILLPPYDPGRLFEIIETSNALRPCIDAYVTNVVKPGWEVGPIRRGAKINAGEADELQSFIEYANSDQNLEAVLDAAVRDRESVGYGFVEAIRDLSNNLSLFRHAPALHTRLGVKHPQEVEVRYTIARGRRVTTVTEFRRFRKFVQRVNARTVWFKEFGDPRRMNRNTGLFEGEDGYTPGADATEILHLKLPSNEPYGVPRWINQLPSIIGSREAEEVNMRYFQENTVPPMMLTVSGGRLTASSFKNLTNMFTQNTGQERQNRIMIVEAVGEGDSLDNKGSTIQMKVEKLTDARQSDALFKDYDAANMAKVRSSWRLGAVLVGMGNETNYANAQVAIALAEAQVFGPERSDMDELLNKLVVNGYRGLALKTCKLVSRVPPISSPEMVIKALTALNVMGGVTPRSAIDAANTFLQTELPQYPEKGEAGYEPWMDQPMARSIKNSGGESTTGKLPTTHAGQSLKDDATKSLEQDGDIEFRAPEHGREGESL